MKIHWQAGAVVADSGVEAQQRVAACQVGGPGRRPQA